MGVRPPGVYGGLRDIVVSLGYYTWYMGGAGDDLPRGFGGGVSFGEERGVPSKSL